MKTVLLRCSLLCLFTVVPSSLLHAQPAAAALPSVQEDSSLAGATRPGSPADIARLMAEAFAFRTGLAKAVAAGEKPPEKALAELAKHAASSSEYALAVVDLGQRLLALGRPAVAEVFFAEAEKALGEAIDGLSGKDEVRRKAGLLEHRAHLRASYLNKAPAADADLAAAAALQPGEKRLARQRDLLPAGKTGRKEQPAKAD